MVIDRTLAAAFIDNNVRHWILGRRLYPFSLWHRFLLMMVQSPFLLGGQVSLFDLREAVAICSLRYPKCKIKRPWIIPALLFLLIYGKKRWLGVLKRIKDKLLNYFGDYISQPEFNLWFPEMSGNGSPPPRLGPIPEVFLVLSDVISFLNCSPKEAWDMSVGQAYWWQMAALRKAGEHINFMDEDEREFQRKMRETLRKPINASDN